MVNGYGVPERGGRRRTPSTSRGVGGGKYQFLVKHPGERLEEFFRLAVYSSAGGGQRLSLKTEGCHDRYSWIASEKSCTIRHVERGRSSCSMLMA